MIRALKQAVLGVVGVRPTAKHRRDVAQQLRELAAEQDRLADAMQRTNYVPPGDEPRTVGKRGRQPARFIRIDRNYKPNAPAVFVGRGFYYELAKADPEGQDRPPVRIDVQRVGGHIHLIGLWSGDEGYAVIVGKGIPRFYAAGSRDVLDSLDDGRYQAEVSGRSLIIGEQL